MRAGLKMVHRYMKGLHSVDRTIMNAYRLKHIFVVPGYRFNKDIALFSAILIADLKQTGDKDSLKKCKNLLERPSSLEKLVSATFRPIVGNMVHLSNDLRAVQQWCDLHKKNVIVRSLDLESLMYIDEFDSKNNFDTIELLKTVEDGQVYYHVLLNAQEFLKKVEKTFRPVKKGPIVRMTQKRLLENELYDAFSDYVKEQFSKRPKVIDVEPEPEPVDPDGHFKPSIPWHLLTSKHKDHLHNCPKCAFPYYNNLPEEECLLTIHSYVQDKDLKVSPYQYLHVTSENFRLGVRSAASKNKLYYLNHVKKKQKDLKNNGDTFLQFANTAIEDARMLEQHECDSTKSKIERFFSRSNNTFCSSL